MKKKNRMYYYSLKYPEHGFRGFDVIEELYLTGVDLNELSYIVTNYDFMYDRYNDYIRWLSVSRAYENEEECLSYSEDNITYLMSYNKKLLEHYWKLSLKSRREKLEKSLKMCIKELNNCVPNKDKVI